MLTKYKKFKNIIKEKLDLTTRQGLSDFGHVKRFLPMLMSIQYSISPEPVLRKMSTDLIEIFEDEYDKKIRKVLKDYFKVNSKMGFPDKENINSELITLFVDYRDGFNYLKRNVSTMNFESYLNLKKFVEFKMKTFGKLTKFDNQETVDYLLDSPKELFNVMHNLNLLNQWNMSFATFTPEDTLGTFTYESLGDSKKSFEYNFDTDDVPLYFSKK